MKLLKTLCVLAIALGVLNFMAFAIIALCLGGDAVNGRSENGRYFLSSHGKNTEVSEAVFNYSRMHVYSVFITHPLAIVSGIILGSMEQENRDAKNQPSR